jgi:CRP-like cAMP-binding protein
MKRRVALHEQLANVQLFSGLTEPQLQRVSKIAVRSHEAAGAPLTREGERGDEFVVVLEGTVEVRHGGRVVATLGAGDHFGEIALVDGQAKRTATVVATTPVTVAYFGRHEFSSLLSESPEFSAAILAAMAHRVAELDDPEHGVGTD